LNNEDESSEHMHDIFPMVDNTLHIINNDNHFYQGTPDNIEDDIKVLRQRVDDGCLW